MPNRKAKRAWGIRRSKKAGYRRRRKYAESRAFGDRVRQMDRLRRGQIATETTNFNFSKRVG